jgi:hypothetical protein
MHDHLGTGHLERFACITFFGVQQKRCKRANMNLEDRLFTSSALTAAAGCEPMTFRTWRNRNGLFSELAGDRKWKRFTIVEVCIVRAVAVMAAHGLAASYAIRFAQDDLRFQFEQLLTGERDTSLVGFFVGGTSTEDLVVFTDADSEAKVAKQSERPEPPCSFVFLEDVASLAETMSRTKGILTIIDLKELAKHVLAALGPMEA